MIWDISRSASHVPLEEAYRVYHIVEEPGAVDWRNEVEVPTEEY